ncbi:hypothetical protein ACQ3I4_05795 [Zafaria sp. Z1313]|uniref:hypothetical protein n=1 Tax=unclassified Zafaria TaxID=2828765 RepID=UPI002E7651D0|nr:hypothetical protein [Zafaria sp. J156]MEE1621234.1 hypothetical protein [Zafaria sp. J156]
MSKDKDTISFDAGAAARIEADVLRIAGRIETIIGDREQQQNFVATNWEDEQNRDGYDQKEKAWITAANNTLELVRKARQLLDENQVTAAETGNKVGTRVDSI